MKRKRRKNNGRKGRGKGGQKREEESPGEDERNWLKGKRMHGRTTSGAKRAEERDSGTREKARGKERKKESNAGKKTEVETEEGGGRR